MAEDEDVQQPHCVMCWRPIDTNEEYIEADCNKCGTCHTHLDCAMDILEKRLKAAKGKQRQNMAFYLRNPQAELVRGKCPRGHGSEEQCPGFITSAEVVRPAKQPPTAPAPAPKPAPRPGRSTSGGAAAAAPGAGKLSKSTKIMASHAKSIPSIERAPAAAPPPQPGILRDRLGRRLEPAGGGVDAGDGAGPPAKKRPPLKFPGGIRPEELTLCRLWEARGECEVPNCVFAHGLEELAEREDEYRAEQARLKREAKEARRLAAQQAAAAGEGSVQGAAPGSELPSSSSLAHSASEASILPWETSGEHLDVAAADAAGAAGTAGGAGAGMGIKSGSSVWDDLIARARAGMQSALSGGSTPGAPSARSSGASTPAPVALTADSTWQPDYPPGWAPEYSRDSSPREAPAGAVAGEAAAVHTPAQPQPAASPAAHPLGALPPPPPLAPLTRTAPPQQAHTAGPPAATTPLPALAAAPTTPANVAPQGFDAGFQAGLQAAMAQLGLAANVAGAAPVDWGALLGGAGGSTAVAAAPGQAGWGGAEVAPAAAPVSAPYAYSAQPAVQPQQEQQGDDADLEGMLALLCGSE